MSVIKFQNVLAWVVLCSYMMELRQGVSAYVISSSSLSSSKQSIRTQSQPALVSYTFQFTQQQSTLRKRISLSATTNEDESNNSSKKSLPFYLDPNTKGGVVVLTFVLFLGTYITDQIFINVLNYDEIEAGITIGMGFTVLSTLAWMSTYLFRVATKDMTYVSQRSILFLLDACSFFH
jgi:Protein of unknown function (DUF3007)